MEILNCKWAKRVPTRYQRNAEGGYNQTIIDYVLVQRNQIDRVVAMKVLNDDFGSDHCAVQLLFRFPVAHSRRPSPPLLPPCRAQPGRQGQRRKKQKQRKWKRITSEQQKAKYRENLEQRLERWEKVITEDRKIEEMNTMADVTRMTTSLMANIEMSLDQTIGRDNGHRSGLKCVMDEEIRNGNRKRRELREKWQKAAAAVTGNAVGAHDDVVSSNDTHQHLQPLHAAFR